VQLDRGSEERYPRKWFIHSLIPALERRRHAKETSLRSGFQAACRRIDEDHKQATIAYNRREDIAHKKYEAKKRRFLVDQSQRNDRVMDFKQRFDKGQPDAMVEYLKMVFERSEYPEGFCLEHEVNYDPASMTAVVDLTLPAQDEVSDVVDYKFVARSLESKPISMKKKEHDEFYDSVIEQAILRTIHEVFESVYTSHVQAAVVNGWVTYTDKATGNDQTSCIISVSAEREQFEAVNLARIDTTECIRSFKGLVAGPLSQVAPVRPIMQISREDGRFVESREVLADIHSTTNLAEIPWEEFEHLVRELFGKMFAGEDSEVRVTQTSADGGVDAIAFDPDPIRGGKFVIQAKRYTKVVPVSAVRDLYGTMISEGAAKGILVTTAHFGRDTRTFVKDKPITLIDGSNLVYLLEKHGHKVRIDVEAARAKMKSKSPG
jgi:restriction system protein